MSVNHELSFDTSNQEQFFSKPAPLTTTSSDYQSFITEWQSKLVDIQNNIADVQSQKEEINCLLKQATQIRTQQSHLNAVNNQQADQSKIEQIYFEDERQEEKYERQEDKNLIVENPQLKKNNQTLNIKVKPIASFLIEIRLNQYYLQNFLDLGIYDNNSLLKTLQNNQFEVLLKTYGIFKPGHSRRILTLLDEDQQSSNVRIQAKQLESLTLLKLDYWLANINKAELYDNFENAGYETIESLIYVQSGRFRLNSESINVELELNDSMEAEVINAHLIILLDQLSKNVNGDNRQSAIECSLRNQSGCVIF